MFNLVNMFSVTQPHFFVICYDFPRFTMISSNFLCIVRFSGRSIRFCEQSIRFHGSIGFHELSWELMKIAVNCRRTTDSYNKRWKSREFFTVQAFIFTLRSLSEGSHGLTRTHFCPAFKRSTSTWHLYQIHEPKVNHLYAIDRPTPKAHYNQTLPVEAVDSTNNDESRDVELPPSWKKTR